MSRLRPKYDQRRKSRKKFSEMTAVDDVSFDVAAGEIFAFLGPNGAGKTSTITMLTTLLNPSGGRIKIAAETGESGFLYRWKDDLLN